MKILFVLYACLIPLVPLVGVEIYRKRRTSSGKTYAGDCSDSNSLYQQQALRHTYKPKTK